tara:strand:- start:229 stop:582 length:354 start_codon:yes stop_codon:yes gene_type:complete
MNVTRLVLDENIDSTVSVNDIIYYCSVEALGGFNAQLDETEIKKLGKVLSINSNVLIVEVTEDNPVPSQNDFIFCVKDDEVNLSSLTGYFAEVKMKNTSTEKAELFRLSLGFANSSQ